MNEADKVLDQLIMDLEDSQELTQEWKKKAEDSAATKALDELLESESQIKNKWAQAKKKLQEAQEKMSNTDEALRAAEAIKLKVTGILEEAKELYDWFVHEPLRNLMIDLPGAVDDEFDDIEAEDEAKKSFGKSMQTLASYCRDEAGPKFLKIE